MNPDVNWGMGAVDHKVIATLLLSLLWFVLAVGVLMMIAIIHWRRSRSVHQKSEFDLPKPSRPYTPSAIRNSLLHRPTCWLAIKNKNLLTVQSALDLHNPKPCSWLEGISGDGDQKLFVSPPVNGWILVIGSALPDPGEDIDACFRFLLDLSRKVGHIQYFISNTVLNYHAWAQLESGRVLRGYAWAGKTLWNQGTPTQAETDLGMKCYGYTDPGETLPFSSSEPSASNSEKVHLLASRWSIDPEDIDERFIDEEWGIVGEPSKFF